MSKIPANPNPKRKRGIMMSVGAFGVVPRLRFGLL